MRYDHVARHARLETRVASITHLSLHMQIFSLILIRVYHTLILSLIFTFKTRYVIKSINTRPERTSYVKANNHAAAIESANSRRHDDDD